MFQLDDESYIFPMLEYALYELNNLLLINRR